MNKCIHEYVDEYIHECIHIYKEIYRIQKINDTYMYLYFFLERHIYIYICVKFVKATLLRGTSRSGGGVGTNWGELQCPAFKR